jgi:hypothetical protein
VILVVTGSRVLADLPSAERWALDLLRAAVQHADTLVTGDAGGPDAWALSAARIAGRRWAVCGLDGRVMRGHGPAVRWTHEAPPARGAEREEWAAWCLRRDRAMVAAASRAHAEGRAVQVLALV